MTNQPQHMEALDRANTVRLRRAEIRQDVFDGKMSLIKAAKDPDMATLTLYRLVQWQRRWGHKRATKLLSEVGATENTKCGDLTQRQKSVLAQITYRNHHKKRF